MDTYSVLDALRRTNMGKLSYSRDFDLRDFDRLSLNEKDDSGSSLLDPDGGSDIFGEKGAGELAILNELVTLPKHPAIVDRGKENLSDIVDIPEPAVLGAQDLRSQIGVSPTTLAQTNSTPKTPITSSLYLQGSPNAVIHTTPASNSASVARRRSKVTFLIEDSFSPRSPKTPIAPSSRTSTLSPSSAPQSLSRNSSVSLPSSHSESVEPSSTPQSPKSLSSNELASVSSEAATIHSPKSSALSFQTQKSPLSPRSPPMISKKEMEALQALTTYELQIEEKSRECVSRRQSRMSEASKLHRQQAEEEYERKKKDLETRQEQQYNELQTKSFASMQETRRTIQEKLALDAKHKDDLQAKLQEAELHKKEHERKKAKEKQDLLNSLASLESEMKTLKSEILASVQGCRFPHLLSEGGKPENVQNLVETMENFIQGQVAALKEEFGEGGGIAHLPTSKLLAQSIEVVETVKKVKLMVEDEVRRVTVEGEKQEAAELAEEEKRRKENEEQQKKKREEQEAEEVEKKKKEEEEKQQAVAATAIAAEQPSSTAIQASSASASAGLAAAVTCDASSGTIFLSLTQQKLVEFESFYAGLSNDKDAQTKTIKFNLQKAVNTLVNSLANDPREHRHRGIPNLCSCPSIQTVGRVRKLIDLHCGQRVDSGSGKWVCVADHPQGLAFVSDLTAKKIVKQGSDVVASNKAHAYPVAAVSVALWIQNPAFGKLLIARFHEICIFTVPLYPKHLSNQSQGEYYKSLGYVMDGDKAENQDDYLARMSGIIRLFATICLTQPPPKGLFGDKGIDDAHPFGLPAAWNWLISHLRLDPISDVSATVLYEFLVVLGNALLKTYTKQFTKVIVVLIKTYLPRIEAVTMEGRLGPVMRLKEFLENSIRCGGVDPPKGQLPDYFWTPAEQTQRDDY